MPEIKVIPHHRIGKYRAPAVYAEVPSGDKDIMKKEAEKLAREKSGLGRFTEWNFIPV